MSASTSSAVPSGVAALAAALRSPDDPPTPGGPSKIELAERAWATSDYVIPRKAQFLLDALLDRLHRARDDTRSVLAHAASANEPSQASPVVSPRYWTLCRETLAEIEDDQLSLVVARHSILPFVAACLRTLSNVADDELRRAVLADMPVVLGRLLPLALRRATGDQVLEVVAAAYMALAQATEVDDELALAVALVLGLCDGSLQTGTVAAPKKVRVTRASQLSSQGVSAVPALVSAAADRGVAAERRHAGVGAIISTRLGAVGALRPRDAAASRQPR